MLTILLVLLLAAVPLWPADAQTHPVDAFDVVWTTPSRDSSGSMPLGNGDVGVNVWVEESGDLVLYVGKTDAWSETGRLLKVGRVRVRFSPNPFGAGKPFRQTLVLSRGEVLLQGGAGDDETLVRIWVDANHPAVRIDAESKTKLEATVFNERWRDQQRRLDGAEVDSAWGLHDGPEPLVAYPDNIVLDGAGRIAWYHRNSRSIVESNLKLQGLAEAMQWGDPLLNRTFGAAVEGDGFTRMNPTALRLAQPSSAFSLNVLVHSAVTGSPEQWLQGIESISARLRTTPTPQRRAAHERWWQEFWDRSYIRVSGGPEQDMVTRAWTLQRFVSACGGRGASPVKANGSIFTTDARVGDVRLDADYRRWGGPFRWSQTRYVYWPMLAAGDFDMVRPLLRMVTEMSPLARLRTKAWLGHDGLFVPETMHFWGSYPETLYGWDRTGKTLGNLADAGQRRYYAASLEILAFMLDYQRYAEDDAFSYSDLPLLAADVIRFYDAHYKLDDTGKLKIEPAQVLDTWSEALNPAPDIAGLRYVLRTVLDMKLNLDKATVTRARKLLAALPPLPVTESAGAKLLSPAERVSGTPAGNENPELYAVFPYRQFGVDMPDLDLARATWTARQSGDSAFAAVTAAHLGLAGEARRLLLEACRQTDPDARFPAFFTNEKGWTPDQATGGAVQLALQSMLLQTVGDRIVLTPAWPKNWDVEFRLRAPRGTTIEGVYKDGALRTKVSPGGRGNDVLRKEPQDIVATVSQAAAR